MTTIISFIIVIGVIVTVHELGHFIAAKLSGVKVDTFSIGYPPKMFSKKIGETEYQIAWIPLGGYVKMHGMLDESFDSDFDPKDPRGFIAQPLHRKLLILTAGVIMNLLLGFLIYSILTWSTGVGKLSGTTITIVDPDYPAAAAGLQPGDRITAVNGEPIEDWQEMTGIIRNLAGDSTEISWQRGDSVLNAWVLPKPTPDLNLTTLQTDTVGKIGVVGSIVTEAVGPLGAFKYGAIEVWWVIQLSGKTLFALLTGRAKINQVTGPIGILKMSGETAKSGLFSFLNFIALISVSIGFLNILPIPMLDGGHIMFALIEAAIRRPISDKVKENTMKVGLAALLLLVTVVSYHDILRLFGK